MKKVSVVIPAYNKAELTVQTVESVLGQTYKNVEILVIDDGSTDDTKQRLAEYCDSITYVYKKNGGACSARNLGISLAKGDYIALLDCDDLYLPKKIEVSVQYFEEHPEVGFVYSAAYFIDKDGVIISTYSHPAGRKSGWIINDLVIQNFICNSTVIVRKTCFDKVGVFDQSVFSPADWDMWLRLSEQYEVGYIAEPLTKYRVAGSYILRNLSKVEFEDMQILQKTFNRNTNLSRYIKQRAFSRFYLRLAMNYLFIGDIPNARRTVCLSVRSNFLDMKAMAVFISFFLARTYLQTIIKKRVHLTSS